MVYAVCAHASMGGYVCVIFDKQNTVRLQHLNLLLHLIHQYLCGGISFPVSISCFAIAEHGKLFHLAHKHPIECAVERTVEIASNVSFVLKIPAFRIINLDRVRREGMNTLGNIEAFIFFY